METRQRTTEGNIHLGSRKYVLNEGRKKKYIWGLVCLLNTGPLSGSDLVSTENRNI